MTEACSCCNGRRYCHWNSHENAQRHLTNQGQRPRRPPKLLQTKTALFSFGGLRGLWSRYVGYFWMQLWMRFQWPLMSRHCLKFVTVHCTMWVNIQKELMSSSYSCYWILLAISVYEQMSSEKKSFPPDWTESRKIRTWSGNTARPQDTDGSPCCTPHQNWFWMN